ncbi:NAD(+) synthase [Alteribacter lacisalsi]|uniref:NH(3)-dependent NAD(+) synthetase n=1 Tax=Alteribacter lacisalsi TaxID=2045244 RepID=A0A2W0HMP0_9BACI|nr:ammonia-dependent NAD(+) synthetase [Alteribacter lacisalsi]PYZ98149.1 NAD(+) synthase [Alteribacter lacisalsi]
MIKKQDEIIHELKVKPEIDLEEEKRKRIDFLKAYTKKSGTKGYVLGISGGQDSSLLGKLIQLAMSELNEEESTDRYTFYAVRLPHGTQMDEDDAQLALDFIKPYNVKAVNIKPAVVASFEQFKEATGEEMSDFVKGNTKARERMKVQYDLAAHYSCLVAGTDHAAEAVTGFYTKFGDGACDVAPLFGLSKRQGKALLKSLGAPERLYTKKPTADLEDDQPLLPDEEALGITYEEIDDYLEGNDISSGSRENLEQRYDQTAHKRQLPVTVYDKWWQ